MTPYMDEARCRFGDGSGEAKVWVGQRNEERKMTDEELAEMPLESLMYYVLVGEGRRTL